MMFIETSALDSTNVEEAFHEVIRKVHRKMLSKRRIQEKLDAEETENIHLDEVESQPYEEKTKCC